MKNKIFTCYEQFHQSVGGNIKYRAKLHEAQPHLVMCVFIYEKLQRALLVPSGVLIVIDSRYID